MNASRPINVSMVVPSLSRTGGGLFDGVRRLAQEVAKLPGATVRAVGAKDAFTDTDQSSWHPVPTLALERLGPALLGWTPGLGRALAQQPPDIIHHHGLWTLNSVAVVHNLLQRRRASSSRDIGLVVSTHGMTDAGALVQSRQKKALAWSVYQARELQHASAILVASTDEGLTLRERGITTPIGVIPNGVDSPVPVAGPAPWHGRIAMGRPVLLFLGRLHPKKGLAELLPRWANALKNDAALRSWSLVVAGWDVRDHESELLKLAAQLGLREPEFCLLGPVYGAQKERALSHASALILPSHSEGMPLSVLEGMAHALPVLISDACHLPQVLASGAGWLANPKPASLDYALKCLGASTVEERKRMGAIGRHLARTMFAWSTVAQSTHQVYNWILEPTGQKPALTWV